MNCHTIDLFHTGTNYPGAQQWFPRVLVVGLRSEPVAGYDMNFVAVSRVPFGQHQVLIPHLGHHIVHDMGNPEPLKHRIHSAFLLAQRAVFADHDCYGVESWSPGTC